jgi:hypothetical protein
MIAKYCDRCGAQLVNEREIGFVGVMYLKYTHEDRSQHVDLCLDCACKLKRWLRNETSELPLMIKHE